MSASTSEIVEMLRARGDTQKRLFRGHREDVRLVTAASDVR